MRAVPDPNVLSAAPWLKSAKEMCPANPTVRLESARNFISPGCSIALRAFTTRPMSALVQGGHADRRDESPLLGVKRTSRLTAVKEKPPTIAALE